MANATDGKSIVPPDDNDVDGGKHFHPADYVVFGITLLLSAAIGVYIAIQARRRESFSTGDYLMASRSMSYGPVALSLIASFVSSVTIIGVPAEYYVYGTMFTWFGLLYLLLPIIIIGIYMPVFYDLGIASAYEYLEIRFDKTTRLLTTCIYLLLSVLYGGIVTYVPALALSKVTGLNMWGSILCTAAVCMFYTTLGGLKAVIWTDVLQSLLMISGFIVVIVLGSHNHGGYSEIWKAASEGGRIDFIHFELDPRIRHSFWSIMIGGAVYWTSVFGVNQSQVQRYICCRTKRNAAISMVISGVGLVIIMILAGMTGLTIYATYKDCDPISSGQVDNADQLFPYIVMDIAGHLHGIPGLFVAAVYSSSLSTISSGINAMACVTLEDFIRPTTNWRELTYTRTARILVILYGISYIMAAYLASQIEGLIQMSYSIHGILGGPITGVFTVGMLVSWVNHWGAICGIVAGISSSVWLFIGSTYYPPPTIYTRPLPRSTHGCEQFPYIYLNDTTPAFASPDSSTELAVAAGSTTPVYESTTERIPIAEFYSLSYLHLATVGFLTTVLVAMFISILTGRTKANPPPENLLSPFMRSGKVEKCVSDTPRGRYFKENGVERSTSWFAPQRLSVQAPLTSHSETMSTFQGVNDGLHEEEEEKLPLRSRPPNVSQLLEKESNC